MRTSDPTGGGARVGGNRKEFCLDTVSLGPVSNHLGFVGLEAALFMEEDTGPILGSNPS